MDLKERFKDFIKKDVELRKVRGKEGRKPSVYPGEAIKGELTLVNATDKNDKEIGFCILCHGERIHQYIRTSLVVDVIDVTEKYISFETVGGFYIATLLDIKDKSVEE